MSPGENQLSHLRQISAAAVRFISNSVVDLTASTKDARLCLKSVLPQTYEFTLATAIEVDVRLEPQVAICADSIGCSRVLCPARSIRRLLYHHSC